MCDISGLVCSTTRHCNCSNKAEDDGTSGDAKGGGVNACAQESTLVVAEGWGQWLYVSDWNAMVGQPLTRGGVVC